MSPLYSYSHERDRSTGSILGRNALELCFCSIMCRFVDLRERQEDKRTENVRIWGWY